MKIKDHPAITWERWLHPSVRINLPNENLDHATLKDVRYSAYVAPSLEVKLEQGGKIGTMSVSISDPHFAQRLYHDLTTHCIRKTVTEIGERLAPEC